MKVVRTFHPVGQGAFYSERFYEGQQQNATHNVIFDCGTDKGYKKRAEKVVKQAFDSTDEIDYLFISHLHDDHISLADTLFKKVRKVKNIILPFAYVEDLIIVMVYHQLSFHEGIAGWFRRMINHIRGNHEEDYFGGDYNIIFVGDRDVDQMDGNNGGTVWQNGATMQTNWSTDWILIPYCIKYRSRKQEFVQELGPLVLKADFQTALINEGCQNIQTGDELFEKLKDPDFVKIAVRNGVLREALKKAYIKVDGGINANSLLVYSGPTAGGTHFNMTWATPYWAYRDKAGCVYTGDSDADLAGWRTAKFSGVWNLVGTIQIPHHGSLDSFDIANNPIDKEYVMPVSCGNNNIYGHPSGKVLAYLAQNGCYTPIVTEMAGSVVMEVIRKV